MYSSAIPLDDDEASKLWADTNKLSLSVLQMTIAGAAAMGAAMTVATMTAGQAADMAVVVEAVSSLPSSFLSLDCVVFL